NYIGTNVAGTGAIANTSGVYVTNGASSNRIGTAGTGGSATDALEGNLISGNTDSGVIVDGSGTNNNVIAGNYIGTSASGTAALGNAHEGVWVRNGAQNTRIGSDGSTIDDR